MVATRRKKTKISYKDVSSEDEPDSESEESAPPVKRSKRKTKAASSREFLKSMFDMMPVELVFEIFSYLHPLDLLNLSRTSKLLRSYLMSREHSAAIWKQAREGVDPPVPECPKDQSEPQWAQLLFVPICSICGRANSRRVLWQLRYRFCGSCCQFRLVFAHLTKRYYGHEVRDLKTVLQCIPYTNGWTTTQSSKSKWYATADICDMAPRIEWFLEQIDEGAPGAQKEFDDFVREKKKEVEEIVASGPALKRWEKEAAYEKRMNRKGRK